MHCLVNLCLVKCVGKEAVDIHHIEPRQAGGSKLKDTIENLMALCRKCHLKYGDKKQYKTTIKRQTQ